MKSDLNILAIIPARGGSKSIPRKNIKILASKPLIAWTIETARESELVDRIIVSTDDAEIGATAKQYGAEVVWRPAEISSDTATSESVLLHTLEFLKQTENYEPDLIIFLQCTSPLTLPEDIDCTIRVLLDENSDTALTVTPFHYFLWRRDQTGNAVGVNHDKNIRQLRQQRDPQFLENGAIYVMRTNGFKNAKHRFFGRTAMYVMPSDRCLEIDDPVDLCVAEVLLRKRHQQQMLQKLPVHISAVVFDFDGVFTDNQVLVSDDGHEAVYCSRSDGLGLALLRKQSIHVLVLSSEENTVVEARCRKLGLEYFRGVSDKRHTLSNWLEEKGFDAANTVFVGNDINDLPCIEMVGCSVAVNDAHPEVRERANIVLSRSGGKGAIRELCDLVLKKLGR